MFKYFCFSYSLYPIRAPGSLTGLLASCVVVFPPPSISSWLFIQFMSAVRFGSQSDISWSNWSLIHALSRCVQLLLIEIWRVSERAEEIWLQSSCGWVVLRQESTAARQKKRKRRREEDAGMFVRHHPSNQFGASNGVQIICSRLILAQCQTQVLKTLRQYFKWCFFTNDVFVRTAMEAISQSNWSNSSSEKNNRVWVVSHCIMPRVFWFLLRSTACYCLQYMCNNKSKQLSDGVFKVGN